MERAANEGMRFDPSGLFVFPHVPEGRYAIRPLLSAGFYIVDIRMGGDSIYDAGFVVDSRPADEIEVTMSSKGGTIQGVARDSLQKAVPSISVTLVPPLSRRQNISLFKSATTGSTGNFVIGNVAPGEYKLFAWEGPIPNGAWLNAEFIAQYDARGQSVTVTSGVPAIADLKVIPKGIVRR